MTSGSGIPNIHEKYRPSTNHCLYFWLVLNKCVNSTELFEKIMAPIDRTCIKKINDDRNKWGFVKKRTNNADIFFCDLNYIQMVKSFEYKKNVDIRIKIKLDTFVNPYVSNDCEKTIYTTIFLPTESTKLKPENEKVFKNIPEKINNLNKFKKLFHYGCTCRFTLNIEKFWINTKMSDDLKYNCGITIKCTQIFILDDPLWYKPVYVPFCLRITVEKDSEEYDGKYGKIKTVTKKLII